MFFVLSKILGFFLVPSNIMVSLGLAGIALLAIGYARAGRWMLVTSIVLIAAVGVLPIGSGLALQLEERFPRWDTTRGPPTGVVVLGGGVINRDSPDDSRIGADVRGFPAFRQDRSEFRTATVTSDGPNGGRGADLAIFAGIWTHSSHRQLLNA